MRPYMVITGLGAPGRDLEGLREEEAVDSALPPLRPASVQDAASPVAATAITSLINQRSIRSPVAAQGREPSWTRERDSPSLVLRPRST